MEYKYVYDFKPADLWKMTMRKIYRSFTCIINVVFTVAAIALLIRFWGETGSFLRFCMIFLVLLFPLVQPLAVYGNCVKQLENVPANMTLTFNDRGLHVESADKTDDVPWRKIANAIRDRDKVTVLCEDGFGYMLLNRTLGEQKESFYEFLCSKIRK